MRRLFRNLIFAGFTATFLTLAPLLVLYTAGWRYNPLNGRIVHTGVLSVSSNPRGATIVVPGVTANSKTPSILSRVLPGEYLVKLTKDGYHAWQQTLTVTSGQTAAAHDVLLLRDALPTLLATKQLDHVTPSPDSQHLAGLLRIGNSAEVWRLDIDSESPTMITQYPAKTTDVLSLSWSTDSSQLFLANATTKTTAVFTLDGTLVNEPAATTSNDVIKLIGNNQAVEIHNSKKTDNSLLGFLPLANYHLGPTHDSLALIIGDNHTVTLVDVNAAEPILLSTEATVYAFNANHNLLAWSDGVELHTFDINTKTSAFITRQSKAIISLAWQSSGTVLLAATNDNIFAFTLDAWKTVTPLLTEVTLFAFWLNQAGDTGYFYGDFSDVTGLFSLPITK